MREQLMEKIARLYVAHTEIALIKGDLKRAWEKADKLAKEVNDLECKYIARYKKSPDFR